MRIYLFIIILSCLWQSELFAQLPVAHDLRVIINNNSPSTRFALHGTSSMFVGSVDYNFLRMKSIQSLEDGEITFQIVAINANEDLEFRLVNAANTAEHFTLKISNQTLTLTENYAGQSRTTDIGIYQEGDLFHIIRCDNKILYTINGNIIHVTALNDNNFEMYGEVDVHGTTGVDFEALVTFHLLPE